MGTPLGGLGNAGSGPAVGKPQGGGPCRGGTRLRCRTASSRGWERGIEVADERGKLGGDSNVWEEQSHSGVNTPGGTVCRVGTAGDIPGVDSAWRGGAGGMDLLEDVIGLGVATLSRLPALDDTCVVSMHPKMSAWRALGGEELHQGFETDSLCLADVAAVTLPAWNQPPGLPAVTNGDSEAEL